MITKKRVLFAAIVIGSAAFAGTAMAGKGGAGGNTAAPGQAGTSPGQVFKSENAADPTTAVSPGQQFNQNRAIDPTTLPPGQTFTNPGRSKP
jgi:hypothetical protein